MSEGGVFRTPAEQLEDFQKEIGEMRTLLRTIADRLTQIERHAKRAFAPAQEARKQVSPRGAGEPRESPPTISPEEALTLFERLTALWKDEGRPSVERRLAEIQVPDLKLIAHQLGVSFSSKPSRRALHGGIIGRINESVMLSKNVNVTVPRSEQPQGTGSRGSDEPGKT